MPGRPLWQVSAPFLPSSAPSRCAATIVKSDYVPLNPCGIHVCQGRPRGWAVDSLKKTCYYCAQSQVYSRGPWAAEIKWSCTQSPVSNRLPVPKTIKLGGKMERDLNYYSCRSPLALECPRSDSWPELDQRSFAWSAAGYPRLCWRSHPWGRRWQGASSRSNTGSCSPLKVF